MRKYLFLGLTLVLIVVLVFLVVRGNQMGKKRGNKTVEIVQESKPTPTRVLTPRDLKIVQQTASFAPQSGGKTGSLSARHAVEIRNIGPTAYGRLALIFTYLNSKGKTVATHIHAIDQAIVPNETVSLPPIKVDDLPPGISDSRVACAHADLQATP